MILSGMVILSIFFEKMKEHLLHSVDRHVKPIITAMFSELTLLGFIGLLLFVCIQSGAMPPISRGVHFVHVEEPSDDTGYALIHLIEYVHIVLFGVMVIFLSLVIALTAYGRWIVGGWKALEDKCAKEGFVMMISLRWV